MVLVLLIASVMAFVWRFPAWQMVRTITPGEIIKRAWLADDGRKLVIITTKIRVFDRATMKELFCAEHSVNSNLDWLAHSCISKRRDAIAFQDKEGCVSVYSLADLKRVFQSDPILWRSDADWIHHFYFSEEGRFIVVPVGPNEYNAYSLTGGEHKKPLIKEDWSFNVKRYFEDAEIVYRTVPGNRILNESMIDQFFSLRQRKPVFEHPLNQTQWSNCALAKDGRSIFVNDGLGQVAKLDLSDPLPSSFDGKFEKFAYSPDASISYDDESILIKDFATDELYSLPNLKHLGSFRTSTQFTLSHECTEDGRMFMRNFSYSRKDTSDSGNFEVIELKTGTLFFMLNNDGEQDFSTKGNAVISYDREHIKLYVRDHPEWWWGHFFRVETWLTILFFGLLMQRLVLNVRGRRRKRAS